MIKSRRFWLGLGVSLVFLALFFRRLDFGEMASALSEANYIFVLPAIALYFVAVLFRALRWKYLLRPMCSPSVSRLYPVVVVGYMANNLLPVRLGELVRSYYLGEREGVSKTTALATVIVERVFDGLVLLFFLAMAALFLPLAGLVSEMGESARLPAWLLGALTTVPFVVVLGLLVSMATRPGGFRRVVRRLASPLPPRVGDRLESSLDLFIDGLRTLRRPHRLAVLFVLSLPVWLLEAAMFYLIAFSFGLEGEFVSLGILAAAILLTTATSNLATSIPSSQGGVGPFEFFAAATLVFLGVEASLASAYVVVLHIALLAPVTVVGLVYLWAENVSLGQLTRVGGVKRAAPSGYKMRALSTKEDPE